MRCWPFFPAGAPQREAPGSGGHSDGLHLCGVAAPPSPNVSLRQANSAGLLRPPHRAVLVRGAPMPRFDRLRNWAGLGHSVIGYAPARHSNMILDCGTQNMVWRCKEFSLVFDSFTHTTQLAATRSSRLCLQALLTVSPKRSCKDTRKLKRPPNSHLVLSDDTAVRETTRVPRPVPHPHLSAHIHTMRS